MRYAVWFVRLIYAAWMIPAGLNHFTRLYPQPIGNKPLSIEVFTALLDSGLFTLVKAVELLAGLAVLFGFRLPLMLLAVLPVSFTVWYWDTELQGWWTGSAVYGWSVLGCNLFLCLAYWESYRAMFVRDAVARLPRRGNRAPESLAEGDAGMIRALDMLRLLLGAVLVVTALDYFLPALVPLLEKAEWSDPMAARVMTAFDKSGLLAVAKFIHLAAGALLLTNRAAPFALAAAMPVNVCGLYISLFLEGDPLIILLAVMTVALNGLLMLTYLPHYRNVLDGGQLADGEAGEPGANYQSLFVNPLAGAPARAYLGAALALLGAIAFYWFVVPFANGTTGLVTLAVPSALLTAGVARALSRKLGT